MKRWLKLSGDILEAFCFVGIYYMTLSLHWSLRWLLDTYTSLGSHCTITLSLGGGGVGFVFFFSRPPTMGFQ
jgi:hypothetical protein